jgi:hypothetical protein
MMRARAAVAILFLFIFGTEAYSTISLQPLWPFVPYKMFSQVGSAAWEQWYFEGIEPNARTFPLRLRRDLPAYRVYEVQSAFRDHQDDRNYLHDYLAAMCAVYSLEPYGKNRPPELWGIRLYRLGWELKANGGNLPVSKSLVDEIRCD